MTLSCRTAYRQNLVITIKPVEVTGKTERLCEQTKLNKEHKLLLERRLFTIYARQMTYNFVALKTQNYVPVPAPIPTKQSINTFIYHIMSESG